MSGLGSVGGSLPKEFYDMLASLDAQGNGTVSPSGSSLVLSKSDQELIDELLAMLPKSWIDPVFVNTILQNLDKSMGLGPVLATDASSRAQSFGSSENAIILAMLNNWVQSNEINAQAFRADIKNQDGNPIVSALTAYINSKDSITQISAPINVDVYQTLQFLRGSPVLSSSLQSIDPTILAKAYSAAEKTLITNFLTTITTAQLDLAAKIKNSLKTDDDDDGSSTNSGDQTATSSNNKITSDQIASLAVDPGILPYQILANYLQDVQQGKQTLDPVSVSLAITGVIGGSEARIPVNVNTQTGTTSLDLTKDSMLAFGAPVITDFVAALANSANDSASALSSTAQSQIVLNFSQIATDVVISAAYWAIPGAITIDSNTNAGGGKTPLKAAALSYARTIAEFINRPEFELFIRNSLVTAAGGEPLTEDQVQKYIAMFKVTLLSMALAGLDKALTGGFVFRGEDFLDLLAGKVPLENGDFRSNLIQLIRQQLGTLDPKERFALLTSLVRYLGTNPKVEQLMDPTKAFLILSDPTLTTKSSLEHKG